MPCIVLLEFVTPGRFQGGWSFPFLQGLLRSAAASTVWLRYALDAAVQFVRDEEGFGLDEPEVERLTRRLAALPATHVVLSARPAPGLLAALRSARPGMRVAVAPLALSGKAEPPRPDSEPGQELPPSIQGICDWAGVEKPGGDDLDVGDRWWRAAPDYAFEPANDLARAMPPVVHVFGGDSCPRRRPLASSPFFAARSLPGAPERWGCSFCEVPRMSPAPQGDTASARALVARQLVAVQRTHPQCAERLQIRVVSDRLAAQPELLAETVLATSLSPSRFLLDYRADELVRTAEALRSAALMLQERGHRLEVCLVGIESFSEQQLQRYLKGYPPHVNLQAIGTLARLEEELPEAFGFREHGGLSTILFDPWTSLAEIALNLATVRLLGVEKLCGKLLTSRLRLVPGLPLELAARQDGLLIERYDDPFLDTARRNFYEAELPWRFANPRIEPVCRVLIRLAREARAADDELSALAVDWESRSPDLSPVERALRVVEEAAACSQPLAATELLRRVSERPAEAGAPGLRGGVIRVSVPQADASPLEPVLDQLAFTAGLKPVMKLEEHGDAQRVSERRREIEQRWPGVTTRPRWPKWVGGRDWELFVGRDPALVDEACALAERIEAEKEPEALRVALARVGTLLGYPECCARAFAATPRAFRNRNEWLWVRRRIEEPGRIDPCVHPALLSHVPCSLACEGTAKFVRRALAQAASDSLARLARLPALIFFDRPGEFVILDPLETPSERFRYRVAAWRTADPRLAMLIQGDTLILEPGLLRVSESGRETAFFALEAFLWWWERLFHPELWREYVGALERPVHAGASSPDASEPRAVATAAAAPLAVQSPEEELRARLCTTLQQVVAYLSGHPKRPLAGFTLEEASADVAAGGWELAGTLRRGEERLRFFLKPRSADSAALLRGAHFVVMHDRATPPDREDKRRALAAVLRAFEAASPSGVPSK